MKLIKNTGNDRVVDELRTCLVPRSSLDIASSAFSLFAYAEVRALFEKIERCRLVIPAAEGVDLGMLGSESDRPFRNKRNWVARTQKNTVNAVVAQG